MNGSNQTWLADNRMTQGLILAVSLVTALSFGLTFGDYISNHPVYLLEGLRLTRAEFLANDWFTTETAQYHQRFTWLVVALTSLGALEWGLALIHTGVVMASIVLMATILRLLDPARYIYAWLLLLLIFVAVDETKSVAASYIFTPALQPSGISALGYLGAIYFFMRRAYWLSGLCLAAAGLFHTNYLVLGFLFFGCAQLAMGWKGIFRRGIAQFILPLLILALELPNIVNTMGLDVPQDMRAEATRIFLSSLSQHYLPATFLPSFIPLIGWYIAGFAFFAGQREHDPYLKSFLALHFGLLTLLALATFFSSAVLIDTIARLFVLRIAPFSLMFAQMLFALAIARMWQGRGRETYAVLTPLRILIATAGLTLVIAYEWATQGLTHTNTLIYGLMLLLMWLAYVSKERFTQLFYNWRVGPKTQLLSALAVTLLLGASAIKADFRPRTFYLICESCKSKPEMELYEWVRTSTDRNSVLLVPPGLRGMRIFGERAIVVDAKGIPYDPYNIKEWNNRMGLILRFFDKNDQSQLKKIMADYQPEYIVFNKRRNHKAIGEILFENRVFQVTRAPRGP